MFFSVAAPPFDHGITWSKWISSVEPHCRQRPMSLRMTAALTSFGMYLECRSPSGGGVGAAGSSGGAGGAGETNSHRHMRRVTGHGTNLYLRSRFRVIMTSRAAGTPNTTASINPRDRTASSKRIPALTHFFTVWPSRPAGANPIECSTSRPPHLR